MRSGHDPQSSAIRRTRIHVDTHREKLFQDRRGPLHVYTRHWLPALHFPRCDCRACRQVDHDHQPLACLNTIAPDGSSGSSPLPTSRRSRTLRLGIDRMHRGFCLPTPRHARHATSIACNSGATSAAGETRRYGFNTALAQGGLRARGGNRFEGRIAECPRLQQIGSSDELSLCCKIAASTTGARS
jgi:hypothetical protein